MFNVDIHGNDQKCRIRFSISASAIQIKLMTMDKNTEGTIAFRYLVNSQSNHAGYLLTLIISLKYSTCCSMLRL